MGTPSVNATQSPLIVQVEYGNGHADRIRTAVRKANAAARSGSARFYRMLQNPVEPLFGPKGDGGIDASGAPGGQDHGAGCDGDEDPGGGEERCGIERLQIKEQGPHEAPQ